MNKYDKSKSHQTFNRSSDIEVSGDFVNKMEQLCLAAYDSGNMDMYVTGINSLAKVCRSGEINELSGMIKELLTNRQ